jgi:hypothetical protein
MSATSSKSTDSSLPLPADPLGSGIELLDLAGVLIGDNPPFQFHRRGELVAVREPFRGEQVPPFDLFDSGQPLVGLGDRGGDFSA